MIQQNIDIKETLFWNVFRNVYIKSEIYIQLNLIKTNKVKQFETLKELKEYSQHKYIETLLYKGLDNLNKGDIKNIDGSLKTISFSKNCTFTGDIIPFGVEEIIFPYYDNNEDQSNLLSSLPLSVRCIKYININGSILRSDMIQPSIDTLIFNERNDSFNQTLENNTFPSIQSGHHNDNTVFDHDLSIGIGFFPQSLTELKLHLAYGTEIKENIIPSSVKILDIKFDIGNFTLQPNVIPSSTTDLKLTNVTNFNISIGSLPNSIMKLKLGYFNTAFRKGILPSNLKSLKLISFNRKIGKLSEFPSTLAYLKFEKQNASNIEPNILPNSITTLVFSNEFSKPITTENVFPNSLKLLQLPLSMKTNNISDWISDGCLSNLTTVLFKDKIY